MLGVGHWAPALLAGDERAGTVGYSDMVKNGYVIHTVGGLHPRLGGPSRTVSQLTSALANVGDFPIMLVSQGRRGESLVPIQGTALDRRVAMVDGRFGLYLGWPLKRVLWNVIEEKCPAILHDHGIWMPNNHFVSVAAQEFNIPRVINPRGMLEPWALRYRRWKKKLALRLYQRRDLEKATLYFATSDQEAQNIRKIGLRKPIAVVPNGIIVPTASVGNSRLWGHLGSDRVALFMSRIHPKKGLINLIEAWGRVRPVGWRLMLAGPDEDGHLAEVLSRVNALGLGGEVTYCGVADDEMKASMFD